MWLDISCQLTNETKQSHIKECVCVCVCVVCMHVHVHAVYIYAYIHFECVCVCVLCEHEHAVYVFAYIYCERVCVWGGHINDHAYAYSHADTCALCKWNELSLLLSRRHAVASY